MCLILIAHRPEEKTPLIVLANRDEFYNRPSTPVEYWPETPGMIAGRDLVSGGTWFGVREDRWAAITNIREGLRDPEKHSSKSRGWLVRDYLQGDLKPVDFLSDMKTTDDFAGFNLLLGDARELWYTSNREMATRLLQAGIYGLSNHLLDTPWPKAKCGKASLNQLLQKSPFDQEAAFTRLADSTRATDAELPETGVSLEWERALSSIFVTMPDYGTRSSTLLTHDADGHCHLVERHFTKGPQCWEERSFSWQSKTGKFA